METTKMSNHLTPIVNLEPNVVNGENLHAIFLKVFEQMASIVGKTYGPYGEKTAYQETNRLLTTKDGWSVEQSIMYPQSMLASIIRKMIIDVSTAINLKAGDGTTTGLIAARYINEILLKYKKEYHIHSKLLESALIKTVNIICKELEKISTKITDENLSDMIYQVACVSLDWNTTLAGFIRDIYNKTGNTIIRVQNSGTEDSYIEYQNGYYIPAKLVSEFKVTNVGEKKYQSDKVAILTFAYTIDSSLFEGLLMASAFIYQKLGRELVVLAPLFDKGFKDLYNRFCMQQIKLKQELPHLVLVQYFADYNIEREMMIDFGFLTGGMINAKENDGIESFLREFVQINKKPMPQKPIIDPNDDVPVKEEDLWESYRQEVDDYKNMLLTAGEEFIEKMMNEYLGICDSITVTDKSLVASGFGDIEASEELEKRKASIKAEIDKAMKNMVAKSMITEEIRLKNIRLGKLKLKMGTINVGGFGESELKAKRDALDDAIRACEQAFLYGIVPGGGIGTLVAINNAKNMLNVPMNVTSQEAAIELKVIKDFLDIFYQGFFNTVKVIFLNRYPTGKIDSDIEVENFNGKDMDVFELIIKSIYHKTPWNIITSKFDDKIIHPLKVETEIVKGVLNLVLNTVTVNQLLYSGYDDVKKELEGMIEAPKEE